MNRAERVYQYMREFGSITPMEQNCFEIVWGHDKWMEVFGKNYL